MSVRDCVPALLSVALPFCGACVTSRDGPDVVRRVLVNVTGEAARATIRPGSSVDLPATIALRPGHLLCVAPRSPPGTKPWERPPHLEYLYDGEPSLHFERRGGMWWKLDGEAARERTLVGVDTTRSGSLDELRIHLDAGRVGRYVWVVLRGVTERDVNVLRRVPSLGLSIEGMEDIFTTLAKLENLRILRLNRTLGAEDLHGLERLTSLTSLYICLKNSENAVPGPVAKLTSLVSLDFGYAIGLTDLSALAALPRLRNLSIYGERYLTDIWPLSEVRSLRRLVLFNCRGLKNLSPLTELGLETLSLAYCISLTDVAPLSRVRSLSRLDLTGCERVEDDEIKALRAKRPDMDIILGYRKRTKSAEERAPGWRRRALTPAQAAMVDDICEVVFRWQFANNGSGLQEMAKGHYLSVGETTDPSDEFMRRFRGHTPPVKRVSECELTVFGSVVKDRTTGERGLIFRVTDIVWRSDTEVEVTGGYYEASMSGSTIHWRVAREGDQWKVKERLSAESS